jgi:hypothetical protein
MEQHEPEPRSTEEAQARAREEHKTWVERYLGEGWQEVEPGIYRPVGQGEPLAVEPPSETVATPPDELGDALDPKQASTPPTRTPGRWRVRR